MKKLIPVIVILLLALGVGFFVFSNKTKTSQPGVVSQNQQSGGKGNIITSIRDAMMKSMSLKCEYPDEKGNTVTTYVKGENVRIMGFASEQNAGQGHILMRDKKMYMWDETKKQGTVIDLNVEVTPGAETNTEQADQKEETIEELEKYKDYCKTEVVADSLFEVPSGIEFVDFAKQMKDAGVDFEKMLDQYKNISPPAEE